MSLESFFKKDFRYLVVDYDRAVIDRVYVYTLKPSDLNHILNKNHDACVEALVNLPNRMGGMNGFKWWSQFYYYNESNAGIEDLLNLEIFWRSSEIKEGRCIKPSF